jgi:tRNA threonylcarbamoyladenosine biosynthesis protein TsaE
MAELSPRAVPADRTIETPELMAEFGRQLADLLLAGDVIVLTGELGAGKTTFTRGLGEGLGVRGSVTSPTFVLARTHPSLVGGPPLVHVDAYRLASALELDDLDIDFANSIVVVEWGKGLVEELTESILSISIDRPRGAGTSAEPEIEGEEPIEARRIRFAASGPRWRVES